MTHLEAVQQNMLKVIFSTHDECERVLRDFFTDLPPEMVRIYRDSVFLSLHKKMEENFPRTKQYFTQLYGTKAWHNIAHKFVIENPPKSFKFVSCFRNFPSYIAEPKWLGELAKYEWSCASGRSLVKEVKNDFLNPSLVVTSFTYSLPKWYKDWLDSEDGKSARKIMVDSDEHAEPSFAEESELGELEKALPLPPSYLGESDDKKSKVLIVKDSFDELRIYEIGLLTFDFVNLLMEGNSVRQTFKILLDSSDESPVEISNMISRIITNLVNKNIFIKATEDNLHGSGMALT